MEKRIIICNLCEKEVKRFHTLVVQLDRGPIKVHIGFECEGKLIRDLMTEINAVIEGKSK